MTSPTPTEIRLSSDKRTLTVTFDNETTYELSAQLLRIESPSAEVQGHDPSQKKIIPGKKNVGIMQIEPVGNYAVRLTFDDMHDTGIYSWEILNRLGENSETLMAAYLSALADQGLAE